MDLSDAKTAVKKYWPWLLGGAIGLFLIMRTRKSSGGTSDLQAFYASQAQAGAAASQTSLQTRQLELAAAAQQSELAMESKKLDAAREVGLVTAASTMAGAVGASTSQVIAALFAPGIAAMQSTAYENASVFQAAGNIAAHSYVAQADMVNAGAQATIAGAGAINAWGGVLSGLGSILHLEVPAEQAISLEGLI